MIELPPFVTLGTLLHENDLPLWTYLGLSGFLVYVYVSSKDVCREKLVRVSATFGVLVELLRPLYFHLNGSLPNEWLWLYYLVLFAARACNLYALLAVGIRDRMPRDIFRAVLAVIITLIFFMNGFVAWERVAVLREVRLANNSDSLSEQIMHLEKARAFYAIPRNVQSYLRYDLAWRYTQTGQYFISSEIIKPFLEDFKDDSRVLSMEALNMREMGDYDSALSFTDQALALDNSDPKLQEFRESILHLKKKSNH